MYLAGLIDHVLEDSKYMLVGKTYHQILADTLTKQFEKHEPFIFRIERHLFLSVTDLAVSGLYDQEEDKKYITLNVSKHFKKYQLEPDKWSDFKFLVSQVCQHESIHQNQWRKRGIEHFEFDPVIFKSEKTSRLEQQLYLADLDEIDAYAHDIAMEIKYYYPKCNPYTILKNISKKRKLWSYTFYKNTFRGEDWSYIRQQLHKKIYSWLPHVNLGE